MDIYQLPQDIFKGEHPTQDAIIFHHYKAPPHSFRGKCILHSNAISLVLSGTKTMHFADKTVRIKSNEIHFLSAGNCMVTMEAEAQQMVESILVFFDNTVLTDFHLRYQTRIAEIRQKATPTIEYFVTFSKDHFISHYIASLQLLLQSGIAISGEMKRLKLEELLLYLLEKCPSQLLSFPLSKNKDLEDLEIRKAVETHLMDNISLEELAFICNLGVSTFKRRFVSIYGIAPGKWLLQKKMELAREMILQGERPSNIYHKLGYETHSSFSQSFRQYFGISPKALKTTEPVTTTLIG